MTLAGISSAQVSCANNKGEEEREAGRGRVEGMCKCVCVIESVSALVHD